MKRYWKQADERMGQNIASRSVGCRPGSRKDCLLAKQSYRVRLGMFDSRRNFTFSCEVIPIPMHPFIWKFWLSFPVLYGERYNDLEKHICSVNNGVISFNHFHPCAALTTDHVSDASPVFVLSDRNYLYHIENLPG